MAPSWAGPSKTLNIRKKEKKGKKKKSYNRSSTMYRAKIKKGGKIQVGVARDPEKSIEEYIRNKRKTKQSVWCAP